MILNRTPVLVPRGDLSNGMTAAQLDMLLQYELYWAWDDDSGQGALYISEDNTLKKIGIKYGTFTTLANGLVPASTTADKRYLGADGDWHGVFSTGNMGLVPAPSSGDSGKYLRSDGTWQTVSGGGTTYPVLSSQQHSSTGEYVVNGSGNNTSYFLRGDGTWTNVAATLSASAHANGTRYFVNGSGTGTDKFLRGDGTWQYIPWNSITGKPSIPSAGINTHVEADGLKYGNINTSYHEVKDYDGNIYHEIQIGNQIWLMEDLKATHYMTDCVGILNDCYGYMNPEHNSDYPEYPQFSEGLYYGTDVVYGGHDKDIIPGYHIPTGDEWQILINFLNCKYNGHVNQALASNPTDCGFDECWNDDSVPQGSPGERSDLNNASGFYARPRGWFDCDDTNEVRDNGNRAVYWCSDVEAVSIDYDKIVPDQMAVSTIGAANPMFRIRLIKNQQADKDELSTVAYTGNYSDLTNKPDLFNFDTEIFNGKFDSETISGSNVNVIKVYKQYGNNQVFTAQEVQNIKNRRIMIRIDTHNEPYGHPMLQYGYILFMTGSSTYIHKRIHCGVYTDLDPMYYGSNLLNPIFSFVVDPPSYDGFAYFVGVSCNRSQTYAQLTPEISGGKYKIGIGTQNKYYTISSQTNLTIVVGIDSTLQSDRDIGITKVFISNISQLDPKPTINVSVERDPNDQTTHIYTLAHPPYACALGLLLTIEMTNLSTAFIRDEYFLYKLS